MTDPLRFQYYLGQNTGSAQRAREQEAVVEPRGTYAWWVRFEDGDHAHFVFLKEKEDGYHGGCIRLKDDEPDGRCKARTYHDGPCAHLFAVWSHTLRYERRADNLREFIGELSECEREVWLRVEKGEYGVREYADLTDRSPGTVGNLLSTARDKLAIATTATTDQQVRADGGRVDPPTFGDDGRTFGRPEGRR